MPGDWTKILTPLLILATIAAGFGLWSLIVSSRYQALCELSYWSASKAQLQACDDLRSELEGR